MKNGKHEKFGDIYWYLDGQLHREDGPAFEGSNGTKNWYLKGKLHREDGPAYVWGDGKKSWWINGSQITEEEFSQWLMKKTLNERLNSTLPIRPTDKRLKI